MSDDEDLTRALRRLGDGAVLTSDDRRVLLRRLRTDRLARVSDSLDAAWAEAEAALPEGWHVGELKNVAYRGAGERWMVMAWEFTEDPDYRTFEAAFADTPTAALRALAAKLRER